MTTVDTDKPRPARGPGVLIAYALLFFAMPLAIAVFRLHMQAWHYYLAGAVFLGGALAIWLWDAIAEARREQD